MKAKAKAKLVMPKKAHPWSAARHAHYNKTMAERRAQQNAQPSSNAFPEVPTRPQQKPSTPHEDLHFTLEEHFRKLGLDQKISALRYIANEGEVPSVRPVHPPRTHAHIVH